MTSGVLGVLFALAQHDLKRLLAYHSVENIGIIALGLGAGLLGVSTHSPVLAVLGFGGGLLHVMNHALFKGLLFLGAGAVAQGAGTREIDRLGGLLKRMPWTGVTFLIGAAAISGLPPLNGFISEFLIYLGAFGAIQGRPAECVLGITVIGALALIGGLAAACFTKAFGVVFLGEPRTPEASKAHEASWWMRLPMAFLALACLGIGLSGGVVLGFLGPVIAQVSGAPAAITASQLSSISSLLFLAAMGSGCLITLILALAWMRKSLLRARQIGSAVTWDCGYARPSAGMQYTASSFAQPLTGLFGFLLRVKRKSPAPAGLFPEAASFETHAEDPARQEMYRPMFLWLDRTANRMRVIQHGRLNLYLLNVVLTLVALLVWELLWAS
jgi:hydrogenase-4 component B